MTAIKTNHPEVKAIAKKCFPDYKGRKFFVDVKINPINVRSCWDGGSRDYFVFYNLNDNKVSGEVPAQSSFDKVIQGAESVQLVPGIFCVRRSYFCGRETGITLMVHPENAMRLLPEMEAEL